MSSPHPSASPLSAICDAFNVQSDPVSQHLNQLAQYLPPPILAQLPLFQRASDSASANKIYQLLDRHYEDILIAARGRLIDERAFLEAPLLFSSCPSPVPFSADRHYTVATIPAKTSSAETTPVTSRKRRLSSLHSRSPPTFTPECTPQTSKTRRRILQHHMPITPIASKNLRFATSPGADALDTLAAVASSAPASPAPTLSTHAFTPTPIRKGRPPPTAPPQPLSPQTWLFRTVASRPEPCVHSECRFSIDDMEGRRSVSATLSEVVRDVSLRHELLMDAAKLCHVITSAEGDVAELGNYRRDAIAVYFTALDGVLLREGDRLRKSGNEHMLVPKLIKNPEFHKTLMALAWECAVSAYGRYDMRTLWTAMKALGISPFDLFKVMESFIKAFPNLPKALISHMLTCDARLIESLVWTKNSELVQALLERKIAVDSASDEGMNSTDDARCETEKQKALALNKVSNSSMCKDYLLEVAFKRLLNVLSVRTQELLVLLRMDRLASAVWKCLKHCVWEKWHLLVDRHVDHIMLCCIYAVAKVQQADLLFRDIRWMYRTMDHVRHASFTPLFANLMTSISLNPHPYSDDSNADLEFGQGDVVKFYNAVFVASMKDIVLTFKKLTLSTLESSTVTLLPKPCESKASRAATASTHIALNEDTHDQSKMEVDTEAGVPDRPRHQDRLQNVVLKSPMRVPRHHSSPRRIGRVTVAAMSPTNHTLATLRNSPSSRRISDGSENASMEMTPGTRFLYAHRESPVASAYGFGRNVASPRPRSRVTDASDGQTLSPVLRPRLLSFEPADMAERPTSVSEHHLANGEPPRTTRTASATSMGDGVRHSVVGVNRG